MITGKEKKINTVKKILISTIPFLIFFVFAIAICFYVCFWGISKVSAADSSLNVLFENRVNGSAAAGYRDEQTVLISSSTRYVVVSLATYGTGGQPQIYCDGGWKSIIAGLTCAGMTAPVQYTSNYSWEYSSNIFTVIDLFGMDGNYNFRVQTNAYGKFTWSIYEILGDEYFDFANNFTSSGALTISPLASTTDVQTAYIFANRGGSAVLTSWGVDSDDYYEDLHSSFVLQSATTGGWLVPDLTASFYLVAAPYWNEGASLAIYYTSAPPLSADVPLAFDEYQQCTINMSCAAKYYYLPEILGSTDEFTVWQCAGENYEVPNCADLTLLGTSSVWSSLDRALGVGSGIGSYPISATSSVYRNYTAQVAGYEPVYFSVQFGSSTIDIPYSSGEYIAGRWCDDPCYGIATSTISGNLECGFKSLFCWLFDVSTSSAGYIQNSTNLLKSRFPLSLYFDITDAFTEIATTTSAESGFKFPTPSMDENGHATITMETIINASTTQNAIGKKNYTDIRQAIVYVLWIIAACYMILRLKH